MSEATGPRVLRAVFVSLGIGGAFIGGAHFGIRFGAGESVRPMATEAAPAAPTEPTPAHADDMDPDEIRRLAALGYLDSYEEAPEASGVTIHLRDRVQPGLNLYASAHAPVAEILDMEGQSLHRWEMPMSVALGHDGPVRAKWFRRIRLFPDGDLIAIYDGRFGIMRMDRDSKVLWAREMNAHHDMDLAADGRLWLLSSVARDDPDARYGGANGFVIDDLAVALDPETGEELDSFSLIDALERSDFAALIGKTHETGDILHANTLKVLDGRHADRFPAAQAGNLLVSFARQDAIAIVDPKARKVVWGLAAMWRYQHEPILLPSGKLILFDNQGHRGMSKIVEFDPLTLEVSWMYGGNEENGFFSHGLGFVQRLGNGNTFITQSVSGRVFEVTPDGTMVWEWLNPNRKRSIVVVTGLGDGLQQSPGDSESIATVPGMQRLEPDDATVAWLTE